MCADDGGARAAHWPVVVVAVAAVVLVDPCLRETHTTHTQTHIDIMYAGAACR